MPRFQVQRDNTASKWAPLATMMVLVSTIGGCMNAPVQQVHDDLAEPFSVNIALLHPYVVNETETDGGLWLKVTFRDCPFPENPARPIQFARVWGRSGLAWEQLTPVDPTLGEQWYWVELPGAPPWIVAGDRYPCSWAMQSLLNNITEGYRMHEHRTNPLNLSEAKIFHHLPFELEPGETRFETTWAVSDLAWRAEHADPSIQEGRGTFTGRIQMYYPDGELWREDEYGLESHNASFAPLMLMPGEYRIVVESDVPRVQPLRGVYSILDSRFNETACHHGFQWDICS